MDTEANDKPDTDAPAVETPVVAEPVATEPVVEGEAPVAAGLTLGSSSGLEIGSEAEAPKVRLPSRLRGRTLNDGSIVATGRRKTAVARVRVRPGNGKFTVNDRPIEAFFHIEQDRAKISAPLATTSMEGKVDVWVRVAGGGTTGQSGAIVLGIARCLQTMQQDLHGALSDGGFLTRDDRMVERKKYGHRKARRSFQFSKR